MNLDRAPLRDRIADWLTRGGLTAERRRRDVAEDRVTAEMRSHLASKRTYSGLFAHIDQAEAGHLEAAADRDAARAERDDARRAAESARVLVGAILHRFETGPRVGDGRLRAMIAPEVYDEWCSRYDVLGRDGTERREHRPQHAEGECTTCQRAQAVVELRTGLSDTPVDVSTTAGGRRG